MPINHSSIMHAVEGVVNEVDGGVNPQAAAAAAGYRAFGFAGTFSLFHMAADGAGSSSGAVVKDPRYTISIAISLIFDDS